MHKDTKLSKILPSTYEMIGLIFLAALVVLIGNSHLLLNYYGLQSSNVVIKDNTGQVVLHGLSKLDNFGITDAVVTFLIWAGVGVICFSVVRAIIGIYQQVKLSEQLSSNKYVHPATFTKAKLWRQMTAEFVVLVLTLLITLLVGVGLVVYGLPTALAYSRTFLSGFSVSALSNLLIGVAIVYVWFVVLAMCCRAVGHYRQLVATT